MVNTTVLCTDSYWDAGEIQGKGLSRYGQGVFYNVWVQRRLSKGVILIECDPFQKREHGV